MSEKQGWEGAPPPDLQLQTAEFEHGPGSLTCASCKRSFSGAYYVALGKTLCDTCAARLGGPVPDGGLKGFLGGALLGTLAALASAVVWWAVRKATGFELGILAIGAGLLVGRAVRRGSASRGGLRYQLLAVFLVYNAVALNYLPDALAGVHTGEDPGALSILAFLYTVPFLGGGKNVIGLVIIGIGLWEAWKINRPVALTVTGPFGAGTPQAASGG